MTATSADRGPRPNGYALLDRRAGLGAQRLATIDGPGGDQPSANEDDSLVIVCNGVVYEYEELRRDLTARGRPRFRTGTDVEVLLHLYEEDGTGFLARINGQFSFALLDRRAGRVILARDHLGVCPLFYAVFDGMFPFGSGSRPSGPTRRPGGEVDLTGPIRVSTFPGLVSPRDSCSRASPARPGGLAPGSRRGPGSGSPEYWDLDYPPEVERADDGSEAEYADRLTRLVGQGRPPSAPSRRAGRLLPERRPGLGSGRRPRPGSVSRRPAPFLLGRLPRNGHLRVPVPATDRRPPRHPAPRGGGRPGRHSGPAPRGGPSHRVPGSGVLRRLRDGPVRSRPRRRVGVVLTGEGADELFAGYIGSLFDRQRAARPPAPATTQGRTAGAPGDPEVRHDLDYLALNDLKANLYAPAVADAMDDFNCFGFGVVNRDRVRGRHLVHQRSYLDVKLRLSDHLLGDHGTG